MLGNSALTIGENLRNHPSVLNFSWSDNDPTPAAGAGLARGLPPGRLPGPADRLGGVQEHRGGSARRARRRGRTTGCRRATGTTPRTTTRPIPPAPTSAARGRSTARRAPGHRSDARLDQAVPVAVRAGQAVAEPRLQPVPRSTTSPSCPAPTTAATRSGPCTTSTPRSRLATARGRASISTSRRPRSRTTRPSAPSSRPTSTTRPTRRRPSTGIVYWQLNKGWPTLLWDLYNYDFDQAGSYFGAKKANEPLHVLYAYDDGTGVGRQPRPARAQSGLSVESKVYGVDGKLLDDQTANGISVGSTGSRARRAPSRRARHDASRRRRRRPTSSSCC